MLDSLRTALPASARDRLYTWAAALVALLAGLGYLGDAVAALWSAVALASVTLLFALLHSTSPWRSSLYAVVAAVGPLAVWYGIGSVSSWAAVLAFAGAVFGLSTATSNTASFDASAGRHRLES